MSITATNQPLAVYIHWPFCKSKCPYCDFNSHVRDSVEQERWRTALIQELNYMAAHTQGRVVTSIFFGGGTPSLMPPGTAQALIERVHDLWKVADDIEITLEANPTSVETSTFKDFRSAGVNRASLGVQSLRPEALKFLGREHSNEEAIRAIESARSTFERYSFDLIYARPEQSLVDWEAELTLALQYVSGHMSLYQLTIEENTAFYHAYAKGGFTMPDEAQSEALYRLTESMLTDKGLNAYEVSNYAKPGQESRHNLSYWKGNEYIGIGPGAHGRINVSGIRTATQTLKSPERWLENTEKNSQAIEVLQEISRQQEVEERVMMGLRLKNGINFDSFKKQTGYDLKEHLTPGRYELFIEKGLLVNNPERLQPTLAGRLVLNTLTAELLD